MTNKARGEVALEIDGEKFIFVATLRAMAEIEEDIGIPFPALMGAMKTGISMKHLLACAKRFAQAGGAEDVSAIENTQDVTPIATAVGKAITASMPSLKKPAGAAAKT